jgi:hypothetical protein
LSNRFNPLLPELGLWTGGKADNSIFINGKKYDAATAKAVWINLSRSRMASSAFYIGFITNSSQDNQPI